MGQFVIRRLVDMKMLIFLALAAFAVAEPEAKAEAKAEPFYYGGYYGHGLGYYGGYGHGYVYGKREAEPYFYSAHPYHVSVAAGASVSIAGHAPAAIPGPGVGYAGAGRYVANSGGIIHVAKREAEAEAKPYYYGGYYGHGLGYYGGYGHGYVYGKREAKAEAKPYYYGG